MPSIIHLRFKDIQGHLETFKYCEKTFWLSLLPTIAPLTKHISQFVQNIYNHAQNNIRLCILLSQKLRKKTHIGYFLLKYQRHGNPTDGEGTNASGDRL